MELFPAANDDQWTLIKRVIDDCDYYLVILAGRYGSLGPDGTSYTEMEYRYAVEHGKPVIGFLHKTPGDIPANRCEATDEGKKKLEAFRLFVQKRCVGFGTLRLTWGARSVGAS
jgi:nucleoside 2-deoxyribosyltransferase